MSLRLPPIRRHPEHPGARIEFDGIEYALVQSLSGFAGSYVWTDAYVPVAGALCAVTWPG